MHRAVSEYTRDQDHSALDRALRHPELPIRGAHARVAAALPPHHRDPFDRMIAAQAQVEELTLVTTDDIFKKYGVRTLG